MSARSREGTNQLAVNSISQRFPNCAPRRPREPQSFHMCAANLHNHGHPERGDKGVKCPGAGLLGGPSWMLIFFLTLNYWLSARSIEKTRKNRLLTYLQIKICLAFNYKILVTFYSHPIASFVLDMNSF